MRLRAAIVDDENLARTRLRQLLKDQPDWEIIGECANGRQAVALIRESHPDLVFLDIQMPGLNGLEVCRALADGPLPLVIFVTAYDAYALQAFEVHAVDYLLKPIDPERFRQALDHARQQLLRGRSDAMDQRMKALLDEFKAAAERQDRLVFKVDGRMIFLRPEEVHWVEAEGNYVRLHLADRSHLVRETLGSLEASLPHPRFLRVSRSALVNLDWVRDVQPLFYGDACVLLRDGTKVTLTRQHRAKFEAILLRAK